ncbi:MAG: phytase [Betaproteobacteria bacterium]|nr:phytase [Betaproteobacteria bacterium]
MFVTKREAMRMKEDAVAVHVAGVAVFALAFAGMPMAAYAAPPIGHAVPSVQVAAEGGDADMDDPAIWIHPDRRQANKSLVVATAKRGGMRVYDLTGRTVQVIDATRDSKGKATQRFNNVDVQYGFPAGGKRIDIAVASDRIADRLRVWHVVGGRKAPLVDVTSAEMPRLFPTRPDPADRATASIPNPDDGKHTAYGLGLYRDRAADRTYAVVTQNGEAVVAMWELVAMPDGKVSAKFVKDWRFPYVYKGQDLLQQDQTDPARDFSPHFEGIAVDQQGGIAYAGQEDVGIWRIHLKNGELRAEDKPFIETRAFDPKSPIARDVEGLAIYYGRDGGGYLIASSQGSAHGTPPVMPIPDLDDTFVVLTRDQGNRYLGSFRIGPNPKRNIDGVQECDGADVTSVSLPGFRGGLLITQDGYAGDQFGGKSKSTNFKITPWDSVATGFPGKLSMQSNYDPRKP